MPARDPDVIIRDLDEALGRQVAQWPDKGSGFEDITRLTAELAGVFLAEPVGDAGACDLEAAEGLRRNSIFLGGSPKGGTTMLVQLFDGHPACVTMPHDSRMVHLLAEPGEASSLEALAGVWLRKAISPNNLPPFWNLGREVGAYRRLVHAYRRWDAALSGRPGGVLVAAMLALAEATGRRVGAGGVTHMVEKTCANVLFPERVFDAFPEARMIHIVRDPYATLPALHRQTTVRNWDWPFHGRLEHVRENLAAAIENPGRFGAERYRLVSYEELVAAPERVMRGLAAFAGLEFDEALLTPTVLGFPAESNSMFAERQAKGRLVAEGRETTLRRWAEVFSPEEQEAALRSIGDLGERLGYPAPSLAEAG